jgi:hypothetical protein
VSRTSIPLRSAGYAAALRAELCERARRFGEARGLPCVHSYGSQAVVVSAPYLRVEGRCEPCGDGVIHGNFLDATYKAILRSDNWKRRLDKVHTQGRTSLPQGDRGRWRELDTCTSSDALLMNIFAYPALWRDGRVAGLLGVERTARPRFGVPARVPMKGNRSDRTEVDMIIASPKRKADPSQPSAVRDDMAQEFHFDSQVLLVEAKLTEFDFQTAEIAVVDSYRDFDDIFQRSELARIRGQYLNYQLIRNVLAAHSTGASFCVLADARRPDLIEAWHATMRAVRPVDLRLRCKVLTWQELASAVPARLQAFLEEKYGIVAA